MMTSVRRPRVLLLHTTTGYQAEDFLRAAAGLNVETVVGTDQCHRLDDPWQNGALSLRFENPENSVETILEEAKKRPFDAIVPIGDRPTVIAGLAANALGLLHNPPEAVRACRNKFLARQAFQAAGLRVPFFFSSPLTAEPLKVAQRTKFPCVLKPLALGASRGVIRADDEGEFVAAFERLKSFLQTPEIRAMRDRTNEEILIEGFISGQEVALEGIMERGSLKPLALFDKPDPLEGPFFEETLYVTPSRLSHETQQDVVNTAERAARAVNLFHGPIHAEFRINAEGVWTIEAAARSIGGLCSRTLRFPGGHSLEELILRHALGLEIQSHRPEGGSSGVMMIPIPKGGILQGVDGLDEAIAVEGVEDMEDIVITAKKRQILVPLPEGASYLGFIFARGQSSDFVEETLRKAHQMLKFEITPALAVH
jgi:biotin carboxylase